MRVTHIYHSGFYIELTQCALLFDYYEGALPQFRKDKPLFVFASHVHRDHFSFSVFTKKEMRGHPEVYYVLSNDIKRKFNRNFFLRRGVTQEQYERITFMKAGETVCAGDSTKQEALQHVRGGKIPFHKVQEGGHAALIRVRTLHSTDAGVAFLVEAEDRRIFHAGDLNWWSSEGENEEDERRMEQAYKYEIAGLNGEHIDIACLPLDVLPLDVMPLNGGKKERFALGFDWFMRHVETARAYPMHYWDDDSVVEKLLLLPCSEPYRDRIVTGPELEW